MGVASPQDFATLADIPAATYAALESGEAEPSAADLIAISLLTDVSVDFLVTGQGLQRNG